MGENSKIAVIFPGIGYTCDKPLLYYSKKLALHLGYEVREVHYEGVPAGIKGDKEQIVEAFKSALSQAETLLSDVKWEDYDSVVFISKSIGTIVAAVYGKKYNVKASDIFFTPLEETFEFGIDEGLVFHGSADPWADTEVIKKGCEKEGIVLHITKDANHSMETGNIFDDIETLSGIIWRVQEYMSAGSE